MIRFELVYISRYRQWFKVYGSSVIIFCRNVMYLDSPLQVRYKVMLVPVNGCLIFCCIQRT